MKLCHSIRPPVCTHLLRSIRELFDVKLVIKVSPDQKVVDSGAEPDKRIGEAEDHHLLVLVLPPAVGAVLADRFYHSGRGRTR